MIFGLIPMKCAAFNDSPKILNIANSFSGGVFLTIAAVHIMPEQAESWDKIMTAKVKKNSSHAAVHDDHESEAEHFPLPFLLLVFGYAFILMIDKVMFDNHHDDEDEHHHNDADDEFKRAPDTSIEG